MGRAGEDQGDARGGGQVTPDRVTAFRAALAHAVGTLVVYTLAVIGAWSLATYQSPPTLAPDADVITIRAPKSRATRAVPAFKPIPCVSTEPLTGTPCPETREAKR